MTAPSLAVAVCKGREVSAINVYERALSRKRTTDKSTADTIYILIRQPLLLKIMSWLTFGSLSPTFGIENIFPIFSPLICCSTKFAHSRNHSAISSPIKPRHSFAVDSERRGARKRKRGDALDGLIDVLGKLHEDTNARLDRLSDRIGYEFDVTKARKEIFQMMGLIPGLTMSQVFIASDAILARVERLDYFMSLPEGARQPYVWHALEHYTSN
ncbi:hypothetical protein SASPL_129049 [Salvia splendens]|uniref:Uncharacterized protein n=1 Tax=Salvia splendens TaxID=180675 RepID=A0A8X8XC30_SALSN|nr:hypothetical protein SASPL_129049 [Salvia splendens]